MHTCHAIGCKMPVPPQMFMCKTHWFMLSKPLRDAIWRTYRPGQCDDMNPSKEYCKVAKECLHYIAHKEFNKITGNELEFRLYDHFLKKQSDA